ncbi:unnamed protein product [Meganyctiphanes norvegica]|uniref:Glucosylceramidase n=2 Tax=Meganyctiphanes norvegica TaxID=48144 RepID=A0AAV2Q4J9_MEGNR
MMGSGALWKHLLLLVSVLASAVTSQDDIPCLRKVFDQSSFVCSCNADYCDTLSDPGDVPPTTYVSYSSSASEARFLKSSGGVDSSPRPDAILLRVNADYHYQTMMGFGGAFTDSAGLNIVALSNATQEKLMSSYFSPSGIEYTLCRTPMAGSDFSVRPYSYDDIEGDVALVNFALAEEDWLYKLPLIQWANSLSQREVKLFGSPWSPPAWMKTNGKFNESGELLPEMYQPWAEYFVKFVEAYESNGAPIWGLTTQNEPLSGFDDNWGWNTCGWTAEDMRDWIKTNLGPTLEAAGLRRLKLMVDDFNRDTLPWYPAKMLEDPEAYQYIDGTAVHWYSDRWVGPAVLSELQGLFPEKFILYTEACEGWDVGGAESVQLGSWSRAENYMMNIIDDVNHYSTGWVDWNMALDMTGGPNWANNLVDAPIIINAEEDEFYKQPTFYAMGHFSKFVVPGMKRIDIHSPDEQIWASAFVDPDMLKYVYVFVNLKDEITDVSIELQGHYINMNIPARSFHTVIYQDH